MAAGEQLGTMACWSCGKEVPVKKTAKTGNLSAPCTWCDFNHYARPGSKHYENVMKDVKLDAAAPPKPGEKKPDPAPASKYGI